MDEWNYMVKYKEILEENIQDTFVKSFSERPNTNSTWNTEAEIKKEKYNTLSLFTLVQKFMETQVKQD